MARKANGQGHTYKVGNSYRTVIRCGDHLITAMAATAQDSRKKAKLKLESMPNILAKRSAGVCFSPMAEAEEREPRQTGSRNLIF